MKKMRIEMVDGYLVCPPFPHCHVPRSEWGIRNYVNNIFRTQRGEENECQWNPNRFFDEEKKS